jgi:hypothetical protein
MELPATAMTTLWLEESDEVWPMQVMVYVVFALKGGVV